MKILILANKLPFPPRDGGSIATLNMLLGLQQAGNQLTCLAMNTSKHSFPAEQIPGELQNKIRFVAVDCDTSLHPLRLLLNALFSRMPYTARRFECKSFNQALQALLAEESYDLVQYEGPYLFFCHKLIRKESHARISLRAHNAEHLIWMRMALQEKSAMKKWYFMNLSRRLKAYERRVFDDVDLLIPISEGDASYFREQQTKTPMLTIPTGLNLDEYPPTEIPSGTSLFFIGALDWLPNQEGLSWFLNKVLNLLVNELPEIRFHVAGRNAPRHFRKKLIHPNIIFHGEVEDARLFMQLHGIMVAPLWSGSGMRIKILEAMALGRPVVTTPAGIEGIAAEHPRTVLVESDPVSFKNVIIKLLKNPEEGVRMGVEARKFIGRDFDNFKLSKRLSQFYKAQA